VLGEKVSRLGSHCNPNLREIVRDKSKLIERVKGWAYNRCRHVTATEAVLSQSEQQPSTTQQTPPSAALVVACPHCKTRLKREKALSRRAASVCPKCAQKFWLDPFQKLFPNQLCLTETQAKYVDFVMGLNDLHCGAAVVGNLEKLRNSLASSGQEPSAGALVRRLMELALEHCINRDEEQMLLELSASLDRFERQQAPNPSAGRAFTLRSLFSF
jgi:hypothetical protein